MPINRDASALFPPFAELTARFEAAWNLNHPTTPSGRFEGFRTFERQAELYAMGRSTLSSAPCYHDGRTFLIGQCNRHPLGAIVTNAMPGFSWHNYGVAEDRVFDSLPVRPGLQASWDTRYPWEQLGRFGESMGLEWAGAWRRFPEQPHFQKTYGLTITEAYELHRTGGLAAVWQAFHL